MSDFWPEGDSEREAAIEEYENSQEGLDANGEPFDSFEDDD